MVAFEAILVPPGILGRLIFGRPTLDSSLVIDQIAWGMPESKKLARRASVGLAALEVCQPGSRDATIGPNAERRDCLDVGTVSQRKG